MAVNVKLGVDLSSFTSGIREGQNVMKGLNAEMKATEAEFKATGNAEQLLANKTKTLNSQIQIQKGIADQAAQALQALTNAGVNPTDAAYQKLYATMMNATAGMNNAQAELNALSGSAQGAASSADQLTSSVQNIGKKISLDQVITGIDKITSGLEKAAKKAVDLGKELWNNIMDSAMLSDDILTQAGILDMTPERYQQYKGVFDTIGEVTITEWAATKRKIEKAMVDPSKDQIDVLEALGLTGKAAVDGGNGSLESDIKLAADNWEDVFWQVGTELQRRVESGDLSSAMADVYGEALFGKRYSSMKNLIRMGQEGFEAALDTQNTISDEALQKDAELNDTVIKLKASFDALKAEVTSGLAPALTGAATALDGLLGSLLEYMQKPEGQEMLEKLGTAVSGLFEDLGKIDPEQVVSGFTDVFTTVVSGVQWLTDNWESVVGALEGIVIGWGALKLTGGILDIVKVVGGLGDLVGMKAAGEAAGAAWGGGFAAAIGKAAPWLIGLWTLLNPASGEDATGNNTIIDEKGNLTGEGNLYGYKQTESGETYLDRRQIIEEAAQTAWDLYRTNQLDAEALATLKEKVMSEEGFTSLVDLFMGARKENENWKSIEDLDLTEWANKYGMPEIPVDLTPATDAAAIAEQIGTVIIPAVLSFGAGIQNMLSGLIPGFANGINSVPYDGMLARLHKGERVMPAREVQSRSYNSNLYVESMYMNNGTDAAGLASAMAAAQRRTMSGFGS